MPNDPTQERPRGKTLISPRYLAARLPNHHQQLLDVFAEDSAWSTHTDESSLTVTTRADASRSAMTKQPRSEAPIW